MDTVLQPRELVDNLGGGGAFLKPKYVGIRKKNQKCVDNKVKRIKTQKIIKAARLKSINYYTNEQKFVTDLLGRW